MHENKTWRIAAIVPYPVFPPVMGGQKAIALFYEALAKRCSLHCIGVTQNEEAKEFPVHRLLGKAKSRYVNPLLFFRVYKLAQQNNCTHLLFEHPYYAWMIALFRWFTHFKIIVHSHNIESERFRSIGKPWWRILRYYEQWAYQLAHFVWFLTPEDRQFAIDELKVNEKKCTVIPYGTFAESLPSTSDVEQARGYLEKQHGIHKNEKIILFNGMLSYKPNLDALLLILEKINPLLNQSCMRDLSTILICILKAVMFF